jgi:hypothetical protein
VPFTEDNGREVSDMARVFKYGRMVLLMKGSGRRIRHMATAALRMLAAIHTRDSGHMVRLVAKEFYIIVTVQSMKASGGMMFSMA